MYKNILLGTDGSPAAGVAADYAIWFAHKLKARLAALYVTDIRILEGPLLADLSGALGAQPYPGLLPQVQEIQREKADMILGAVAQKAAAKGVPCNVTHETGNLVQTMLTHERQADVVVLGQHGEHAPWSGGHLGSSVERVVRASVKPCLVTPETFQGISHLLLAYDGSADAISKQIQSCAANQFVLLGPGTFHLNSSIDFGRKDNVALRGSGANSTLLVFSAAGTVNCNLGNSTLIALCSTDQTDLWSNPPVYKWTDGLGQGSTQLTLSGSAGIVAGSMLFLSQNDDGYSGYNPTTGSSIDNNGYFVCADKYQTNPTTGCVISDNYFCRSRQLFLPVADRPDGACRSVESGAFPDPHGHRRAGQALEAETHGKQDNGSRSGCECDVRAQRAEVAGRPPAVRDEAPETLAYAV